MSGKICPFCRKELSEDLKYCPYDGKLLISKPIENFCMSCNKQYTGEFKFCPIHGEKLCTFTPKIESEDDEEAIVQMSEEAHDSFHRSLCPKCGAWKNWSHIGKEYTCNSCNEVFIYENKTLYGSKKKSQLMLKKESQEAKPYAKVLATIDMANKEYWLKVFEKFNEYKNYYQWNWPSFFFGANRYLWKGMWKKGLIVYGIMIFGALLSGIFITTLVPDESTSDNLFKYIYFIGILSLGLYLGANGAKDYYNYILKLEGDNTKAKNYLNIGRAVLIIVMVINFLTTAFL